MNAVWEIFRFEVAHQARQRATWIYAAVFVGLAFIAMTSFVTGARGSVFNAPLAIAGATIVASMFGLLVTAALAGDVATRDARTRIEPLLHTVPISKSTYLGGRFLGVVAVNALLLATVPLALVVAGLAQRLEPELVGPFRPAAYLGAYFFFALPNAFITTALLFSLATINRTAVASYVGALVLFLGVLLNEGVLAEAMGRWELATVLDPFGLVIMRALVRSWTPAQKDSLLITLEGALLLNRLLWLAIAMAALALTHLRFPSTRPFGLRLTGRGSDDQRGRGFRVRPSLGEGRSPANRSFDLATHLRQAFDIARRSFRAIVMSRGALVLAVPALFVLIAGPNLMVHMGTPLLPTTEFLTRIFVNSGDIFLSIAAPFLIVVYAGELIWREREAGLSDITDATPVPDWVLLLGKFLGLTLVLVLLRAHILSDTGGQRTQGGG